MNRDKRISNQIYRGVTSRCFVLRDEYGTAYGSSSDSTRNYLGPKYVDSTSKTSTVRIKNFPPHSNGSVVKVTAGFGHMLFLCKPNTLFSSGSNVYGQCGTGDFESLTQPRLIKFEKKKIVDIACSGQASYVFTDDNQIYSCGDNEEHQLGHSNGVNATTFTRVEGFPNKKRIRKFFVGFDYMIVQFEDNTLCGTGCNEYGELGLGDQTHPIKKFTTINTPFIVDDVECGASHTLVLSDGKVYSTDNAYSQLGLGHSDNRSQFCKINMKDRVKILCCGCYHSLLLTVDHKLFAFGKNDNGRLGSILQNKNPSTPLLVNTKFGKIVDLFCTYDNSYALTSKGVLYACGEDNDGRCAVGIKHPDEMGDTSIKQFTRTEFKPIRIHNFFRNETLFEDRKGKRVIYVDISIITETN